MESNLKTCPECDRDFHPLGYASHRAMHRRKRRKMEEAKTETKPVISCPYRPIIEQELDRYKEEKPIRESNQFYWKEYPKRTIENQEHDH